MRLFALALLLPLAARADDWVEFRSGPFEVWTNAGSDSARVVLNHLEQMRHIVGRAVGKPELATNWPVRVVVMKNAEPAPPALARDTYTAALPSKGAIPAAWTRELVRIFIEDGALRMPPDLEAALIAFYSTAQIQGTRITLGAPVAPAERDLAWAKVHLLQTSPEYAGKIRALLYNLQQGVEPDAAFRNAFGKSAGEIDKQAAAYLAAGQFGTWPGNARPINAQRDFHASYETPPFAVALADLKLVKRAADARAAYEALLKTAPAAAHEGLGLLALAGKRMDDARREFAAAVAAGTTSARAQLEYARLEENPAKKRAALAEAAKLNPRWPEPHAVRAAMETDPLRKQQALEAAAKLAPRDAALWRALAESDMAVNKYPEAARAWAAAERASVDEAERASIREARRSIEERRLEWQAEERRRAEAEREKDLRAVREKALAEIRAAEARANRGAPPAPADRKIVPLFEGPPPDRRVRGRITSIECVRGTARFTVQTDAGAVLRLIASQPAKVIVFGPRSEDHKFECGPQKPPRQAIIEYFRKEDPKTGSSGEVASIEYAPPPGPSPDAPKPRKKLGPQ